MLSKTISTKRSASFFVSSAARATSSTSSALVMHHLELEKDVSCPNKNESRKRKFTVGLKVARCAQLRTLSENNDTGQDRNHRQYGPARRKSGDKGKPRRGPAFVL